MKVYELTAKIEHIETSARLDFDVIFLVATEKEAIECFNKYYYGNSKKYEVKDLKIENYNLVVMERCDLSQFMYKTYTKQ